MPFVFNGNSNNGRCPFANRPRDSSHPMEARLGALLGEVFPLFDMFQQALNPESTEDDHAGPSSEAASPAATPAATTSTPAATTTRFSTCTPRHTAQTAKPKPAVSRRTDDAPRITVQEDDEAYLVNVQVPGWTGAHLNVHVADNDKTLVIAGTLPAEPSSEKTPALVEGDDGWVDEQMYNEKETPAQTASPAAPKIQTWHSEFSAALASFERRVTFPRAVQAEQVRANLNNGLLSITVPKAAERTTVVQIQ